MLISALPLSVFGATAIQEPVKKDGTKYTDITASAGNSSANLGDKITANGAKYDIKLDGEIVGSFTFNKNNPCIEIAITDDVLVDILWSCGSKYADCTLNGAGIYQIPQLLQDNGKTQNFDAIWVTSARGLTKFDDSDNDGLPDWLEKLYGMNPNNPDTLGDGILDGDRIFEYTAVCEDSTETDSIMPALTINLQGKLINSLEIRKISVNDIFLNSEMWGYIGNAFEFNLAGEFESAMLTFEFDASLLNNPNFAPTIYYWNSEIQFLEELPNQVVSGNKVSAEITHFSEYVVLDKNIRQHEILKFEILPPVEDELQKKRFDLVLVLDESGSINTANFNDIKFISEELVSKLSLEDRVAVYAFDNRVRSIISLVEDGVPTDKYKAIEAIRGIRQSGGSTAIYDALRDAVREIVNNPSSDASKIIVLLTDGQNNAGSTTATDAKNLAIAEKVVVYTIGIGSVNALVLRDIAVSTGGEYYGASNFAELAKLFNQLETDIDLYKDTDEDGISDYHEKQIALGNLRSGSGAPLPNYQIMDYTNPDSDGDGLFDGQEMAIRNQIEKINGVDVMVYYAYMFSNPCVADTDGDGWIDSIDPEPLRPNVQTVTNSAGTSARVFTYMFNPAREDLKVSFGTKKERDDFAEIATSQRPKVQINAGFFDPGDIMTNNVAYAYSPDMFVPAGVSLDGAVYNEPFNIDKNPTDYNYFYTLFIYKDGTSEVIKTNTLTSTQVNEKAQDSLLVLSGIEYGKEGNRQRTLIGVKSDGSAILMVVDSNGGNTGMSIFDAKKMLTSMGAVNILNLDGGCSSRMYIDGIGVVTNQFVGEPNRLIGSVLQIYDKKPPPFY
jgi:exopolysaccharide biosynthesis protein/Mg-chelatase subunit ChlD